jgi:DNA polymerase-3 subunit gamma/tau
MAFYHVYRPKSFEEMSVTQPDVAGYFQKAIQEDNYAHVYLFVGSHGIGKTSAARILARAVNCTGKKKTKPCNECENCLANLQGSFVDLYELDAASNRGIDDVRQLQEIIRLSPMQGVKKVYIIDEVHMLTTEAFNALLKTFEEPPAARLFVLCTTELQKVPLTIQSRATVVHFQKPDTKRITFYLQKIAESENLQIAPEALEMLAQHAQGAYRDAAKLLEQVSVGTKSIGIETVKAVLKGTTANEIEDFARFYLSGDCKKTIELLERFEMSGVSATQLVHNLIVEVRALLRWYVQKKNLPRYLEGVEVSGGQLVSLLDGCQKCLREIKLSPIPYLPVELMVYERIGPKQESLKAQNAPNQTHKEPAVVQTLVTTEKPIREKVNKVDEVRSLGAAMVTAEEVRMPVADAEPQSVATKIPALELIQNRWKEVVLLVKDSNASVASVLRTARPYALEDRTLHLMIAYRFHKERLEAQKNRMLVEAALFELFGVKLRLACALEQSKVTKKDLENVKEVQDENLVEAALEIFGQ